jgi:hypothetical protein
MAPPSVKPARGDAAGARGATAPANPAPRVTARGLAAEPVNYSESSGLLDIAEQIRESLFDFGARSRQIVGIPEGGL